jgi:hypothetical protein
MSKNLILFDDHKNKEFYHKTNIEIYVDGTDELLFKGTNKVLISGSAFTAMKHFDIVPSIKTNTYNSALSLENTVTTNPTTTEKVILFAVGTDGCGTENSQVYPVDYTKWIKPEALVPFKYQDSISDISASARETYFGRKVIGDKIAYYFKTFETLPILKQQYIDGTPIDAGVFSSQNPMEAETYVELRLKILKEDCRDFFLSTTGINSAKINSLSLLTAWYTTSNGFKYYQDIRPLTKLNIPNEPLIELNKGLDIVYQIYY